MADHARRALRIAAARDGRAGRGLGEAPTLQHGDAQLAFEKAEGRLGDGRRGAEGEAEALQRVARLRVFLRARDHGVVDARDAEVDGRADVEKIRVQTIEIAAARVVDHQQGAVPEGHQPFEERAETVVPGEIAEEDVFVRDVPHRGDGGLLGEGVPVGQLDALRVAGGAARIEEEGDVLLAGLRDVDRTGILQ